MDEQLKPPVKPIDPVKRKSYSLDFKANVIKEIESGKKTGDVGRVYNLAHSTVCSIWKDRDKIMQAYDRNSPGMKRVRNPGREDIDQALFEWFRALQEQDVTINNFHLMAKADEIAEGLGGEKFKCTIGWLSRFKGRHGIRFRKGNDEATREKNETTSVDHDVSSHLELELTTSDSTDPEIKIKDEPMSDTEEGCASGIQDVRSLSAPIEPSPRPGVSTVLVPSVFSVCTLSKPPPPTSSGEILGVPVGDLPMRPGMSSTLGDNSSATNGVLDKNASQSSTGSMNETEEETKFVPECNRTRDQFDVYGEYIASKLRSLDLKTCAYVQKAFGDIIFEAEMGKYNSQKN